MRGQSFKIVKKMLDEYTSSNDDRPFTIDLNGTDPLKDLHSHVRIDGYSYYAASAYSGKKNAIKYEKDYLKERLYRARIILEKKTEKTIDYMLLNQIINVDNLINRQFFGISKKQGISFRLGLSSCTPTSNCAKYCYAHDGRERSSNIILRCCINTKLIQLWYLNKSISQKFEINIFKAIDIAIKEFKQAKETFHFERRPRIRLSHVGDIGNYPEFANWIAAKIIKLSNNNVIPVIYTRTKKIDELNSDDIIINYSIDPSDNKTTISSNKKIRIVASAWDGLLTSNAEINFLEHHDNNIHAQPKGSGFICPVTDPNNLHKSCDEANCDMCFRQVE